jgi:hypothetical protein
LRRYSKVKIWNVPHTSNPSGKCMRTYLGGAVQVDSVKTRVDGAFGFSA